MKEYDIEDAFAVIEEELIESMIRNMKRHRVEEADEKKQWAMWQAMQLESLEKYKKANKEKFNSWFSDINGRIDEVIREANKQGYMDQEIEILKAIKEGFEGYEKASSAMQAEFFKLNERKLESLLHAVKHDMERAETAILRRADDQYRKAIFNAQMYANTGAGTYEKAVDMATKDMLSAGLQCVTYANGAMHTLKDYADMAIRTASKRAYLQGEGLKRQEWGISTVIVNKRGNPCPKCLPFCGKVLIDDVWSGGARSGKSPATGLKYPLMSRAVAAGLYHPRCKDSHTTYFEGISASPDSKYTRKELDQIAEDYRQEQKAKHAEKQEERFRRLGKYSLDEENRIRYGRISEMWRNVHFKTGSMNGAEYTDSKRPLADFRAIPQERAVNILRQDSEEWIRNLTEEEKRVIRKYTYNSGDKKPNRFFERLNAMLRGDLPKDEKLESYAETISGALKKNRLKQDVICYRNVDINPIADRKSGSLVKFGQFTSTSVKQGKALNKECKITIYAPKGTTGAYIEGLSEFPKQREVLLDKDCVYRVISNKGNKIELEVII